MQKLNPQKGNYQRNTQYRPPTPRKDYNAERPGPKADCEICGGLGFVYPIVDGVTNYSDTIACPGPGCLAEQTAIYRKNPEYAVAKGVYPVKEGQELKTFKNFNRNKGNLYTVEGIQVDIRGELEKLAAGKTAYVFALLYGQPGNGKSHLCSAFTTAVIQRGAQCAMWDASELLTAMRQGIDGKTIEETTARCKNIYALIIDDIKLDQLTPWGMDRIEEILSYRYQMQLVTLITTNVDIEAFPERLRSRFNDAEISRMFLNNDIDRRPKQ